MSGENNIGYFGQRPAVRRIFPSYLRKAAFGRRNRKLNKIKMEDKINEFAIWLVK
jgi:hypothetical protein